MNKKNVSKWTEVRKNLNSVFQWMFCSMFHYWKWKNKKLCLIFKAFNEKRLKLWPIYQKFRKIPNLRKLLKSQVPEKWNCKCYTSKTFVRFYQKLKTFRNLWSVSNLLSQGHLIYRKLLSWQLFSNFINEIFYFPYASLANKIIISSSDIDKLSSFFFELLLSWTTISKLLIRLKLPERNG